MFTKVRKDLSIRIVLVLVFIFGWIEVIPAHASAETINATISEPDFLNDDGTLKLDETASASFQADNWAMQFDPERGPLFSSKNREAFSPLSATIIGNWSALGSNLAGTDGAISNPQYSVWDIAVSGTDVYIVGCFNNVGGDPTADNVAKWDGTKWSGLGNDGANPPDGAVKGCARSIAVSGNDVYVGSLGLGNNNNLNVWIGGSPAPQANGVAKWNGTTWSGLGGDGMGGSSITQGNINSILVMGSDVYVGGTFTDVKNGATTLTSADYIAKWDGANWSALGNNGLGNGAFDSSVWDMVAIGNDLYVGGSFNNVYNGLSLVTEASKVAKWDGTQWSSLGSDGNSSVGGSIYNGSVYALATDDNNLYVSGDFSYVNNYGTQLKEAVAIAKWDGVNWSALGGNGNPTDLNGSLHSKVVNIVVAGGNVYAGGGFVSVNNYGTILTTAAYVAKWDGTNWSALGSNGSAGGSLNNYVYSLANVGDKLYVGGDFTNVNNNGTVLNTADYIAAYDVCSSSTTVQNTNDSGAGSLRQAIADICSEGTVNFDSSLSGQTITLASNLVIEKSLTIDGSGFSPQIVVSGGNIAHLEISTLSDVTISDLTIANGYSENFGGAIESHGHLTILNSTLRNSHAVSEGGAIASSYLILRNTTIYQNTAGSGGAISLRGSSVENIIVNSTITENQAGADGGAIEMVGVSEMRVFNSTFAHNIAMHGSELYVNSHAHLVADNTIFVCSATVISDCYLDSGFSVSLNHSILGIGTLADYGLSELADNGGPTQTMALLPNSPLIDAGDDSICVSSPVNNLDQRGATRPQGSHCDISAYEAPAVPTQTGPNFVVNTDVDTDDGLCGILPDNSCTLREAINAANSDSDASEITFAADYTITLRGSQLPIVKTSITIDGNGVANTILQANVNPNTATYRVFEVTNAGNLTLNNLTIRNGRCNGTCSTNPSIGGGIYSLGTLTVMNSTLSANSASEGGGIDNLGTLTVTNSILSGNSATYSGGGIYSFGMLTVTNSTLSGNLAYFGGGILNDGMSTVTDSMLFANSASYSGGGINNTNSSNLTVTNSTLSANLANFGGGILNSGILTVTDSTLSANLATIGGGIHNELGTLTMTNSILSGNSASYYGGGVYNTGNVTVTNSTLSANSAIDSGGGISNIGTLTLINSTLSTNSASTGGGIFNELGVLTAMNSTLSANSASAGGGIYNTSSGTITVTNSTLSANSASTLGGGILNFGTLMVTNSTLFANLGGGIYHGVGAITLHNTIVANSSSGFNCVQAAGASGTFIADNYNLDSDGSCDNATQRTTAEIDLLPLADNGGPTQTMALGASSVALDTGNDANCPAADQRGATRPQGSHCDTGAYEVNYLAITGNVGMSGVTLNYIDKTFKTVTADGSGNYSVSVPVGWSGTIAPSKVGYNFSPVNRNYVNVSSIQVAQNYVATSVPSGIDTTGVFRPSNGLLYLKNTNATGFADVAINYGTGGDYPVTGDWDGNGTATIGIYRNGSFYLRNSNTLGFADMVFAFGQVGDQPVAGDWNGDGTDTIGVYRPSTGQFLLRDSNSAGAADYSFYLGNVGDVGIAGDWTAKGFDTVGVFRPSNGIIFLKNTNQTGFADIALNYGLAGDQPVVGDWDGNGTDTIGVYRNAQFLLRNSNTIGFADIVFGLGNPGDMPIAGDWDGLP